MKRRPFPTPAHLDPKRAKSLTNEQKIQSSFNFHMEVGEWLAVEAYRTERGAGLRSTNEDRQRKAERDYQKYRDIAGMLIARKPELRRATRNRLAKEVQAELVKQGRGMVSARTIWEALRPKKV